TGRLDVGALARGLDAIVCRHETLRTSFATVEGQPVQQIGPERDAEGRSVSFPLELLDLRRLPKPTRAAEVQRVLADEVQRPFDLTAAPLARATLLRLGDGDHVLSLTMHHII